MLLEPSLRRGVEWDEASLPELGLADDEAIRCHIGDAQREGLRDAQACCEEQRKGRAHGVRSGRPSGSELRRSLDESARFVRGVDVRHWPVPPPREVAVRGNLVAGIFGVEVAGELNDSLEVAVPLSAPGRALDEAARVVLNLGDRVGQRASAQSLVDELGLAQDTDSGDRSVNSVDTTPVVSVVNSNSGEVTPTAEPRRHSTQLELMAVAQAAEAVGRKPEAAAILAVAVREGPDPRAAQKLEAHFVQRGAWRELAGFYRDTLNRTTVKADRGKWAEKLAELLESELKDSEGGSRWPSMSGHVCAASGGVAPLWQAISSMGAN